MENKTPGLEALEKAKEIISDYSGAYMNENVPESEIYGIRKEKYKEYAEKDNMLYNQLDIVEKELKEGAKNKNVELTKEKELLLKAMETGYIWYPLECPEDCFRYRIECLYFNHKMGGVYYLYVADGVGEIYAEDFGKTWSIDKPANCPNDD